MPKTKRSRSTGPARAPLWAVDLLSRSPLELPGQPAPIRAPLHAGGQDGPGHGDGGGGDLHAQEPRSGPRTRRSGTKVYTPPPERDAARAAQEPDRTTKTERPSALKFFNANNGEPFASCSH